MRTFVFKTLYLTLIGIQLSISAVYDNAMATLLVKKYSTEEMVEKADTIAIGKVTDVSFEQNDKNQVFTFITIECEDLLKGDGKTKTFKVFQEGGKTKDYTTAVYGAPNYTINEEVVLFLRSSTKQTDLKKVIALNQGKYQIQIDPQTKEKYAVSDLTDADFLNPVDQATERKIHKFKFDDFINELKKIITKQNDSNNDQNNNARIDNKQSNKISKHDFDWITWIKDKIIYHANNMAALYNKCVIKIKDKSR